MRFFVRRLGLALQAFADSDKEIILRVPRTSGDDVLPRKLRRAASFGIGMLDVLLQLKEYADFGIKVRIDFQILDSKMITLTTTQDEAMKFALAVLGLVEEQKVKLPGESDSFDESLEGEAVPSSP